MYLHVTSKFIIMQLRVIAYEDELISNQGLKCFACMFFSKNNLLLIHIKALLLKLLLHNP